MMKRLIFIITFIVLAFSCNKYDDAWISSKFESINEQIQVIDILCNNFNKDIVAMQDIISAIEQNDMITDLSYDSENNRLSIVFRDKGLVTITVIDGKNGKDTRTFPVISVRKDTDGIWYWTIGDEWCKDKNGNKVPTLSNSDVTPMLKIEDDYWFVSYDGGSSWDKLQKATGDDGNKGDLMISDFMSDNNMVYISLPNGEQLVIPMEKPVSIDISSPSENITAGQTFALTFKVIGIQVRPEVTCIGEHGWKASVRWNNETEGELIVKAPEELKGGKIVVFVKYGDYTTMKAVNFDYDPIEAKIMSVINEYFEVDGGGGVVNIKMLTNQAYSIEIPESAKSWISHVRTKTLREEEILFAISANASGNPPRSASIKFIGNGINVSVTISQRSKILLDSEIALGPTDGFDNPEEGIVVLQTASKGNGTDIIIMGDGFSARDFIQDLNYKTVMEQAYEDFFSVEPYASLKEYFNVYYINAVSEEAHDATPYYDAYGNQNGAINGSAATRFSTVFKPGSTSVSGNSSLVHEYAKQAIRYKGGPGGTACTSENEISARVGKALMIVMINVKCYAGTCYLAWTRSTVDDYGNAYSIAWCPLGTDGDRETRKWTIIHEAGGHGFGKLSDEYEVSQFTSFSTSEWSELALNHSYGVDRNVNEYWTYEESLKWEALEWEYTTNENVYWSELLQNQFNYVSSEGLGIYQGGHTYSNMFCRATNNSVMRNHHIESGQFFNAISRWAIWYRLMRLTNSTTATNFKASLNDFIEFDKTISSDYNFAVNNDISSEMDTHGFMPLGKTEKIEMTWVGNELVPINYVSQ